ncbi:YDR391C-like protein [Saccharomyces cerevisiae x Saccharomyces kudriavzevii VIN7]|uniref:YDR391C-like protein n=1 Tax=Saccharomyces cerevisiae x Saccharomyces kudriavzevii (strain VIN7) TaxID=1095631 RepID=H0H0Y7_SACCK|nr:YDR391C-like protein [Saccharomyces cerevisiae x Saccharomyces kudriavzevii VIN7]
MVNDVFFPCSFHATIRSAEKEIDRKNIKIRETTNKFNKKQRVLVMVVSAVTGKHTLPVNLTCDVERASKTLFKAFEKSYANDYLMKKFFHVPITEKVSRARINAMIHYYTTCYNDLNGEVAEANDFDAVAIWSRPGCHLPATLSDDESFNKIFFDDLTARKHEVMPEGMDYYYLYAIGKDPSHPEIRGSVRKILEEYKLKADKANCALALEAISEHAKSVYEYFGFRTYLVFQFGVGEVNCMGEPDPQGEGFTAYLMLYHRDANSIFHA